jgi:hypothetical protein
MVVVQDLFSIRNIKVFFRPLTPRKRRDPIQIISRDIEIHRCRFHIFKFSQLLLYEKTVNRSMGKILPHRKRSEQVWVVWFWQPVLGIVQSVCVVRRSQYPVHVEYLSCVPSNSILSLPFPFFLRPRIQLFYKHYKNSFISEAASF